MMKGIYKLSAAVLVVCLVLCGFSSCAKKDGPSAALSKTNSAEAEIKGVFLGVKDLKNATRDIVFNSESRVYQFEIDGETKDFRINCDEDDYPVQNRLMMGYEYILDIDGDTLNSAVVSDKSVISGIVNGYTPGERTLKNFLKTAVAPLGKTLYVYGGAWNVQDDGSSYIARTIGVSPTWEKFYNENDANYSYKNDTYPTNKWNAYYYAGLDCSGYIGWVVYNTMYDESEKEEGFVCFSKAMAKTLADKYNFGTFLHPEEKDYQTIIKKLHPGDVISIAGHAYIVVGVCDDGSAVIIHSTVTPSETGVEGGGVQFSAVSINGDDDTSCKAYKLAKEYTEKYFPEWAKRYPVIVKPVSSYFDFPDDKEMSGIFTWSNGPDGLTDPDNIKDMSAEEVLKAILQ